MAVLKIIDGVYGVLRALIFPAVVYLGLTRWGPRTLGLVTLGLLLPSLLLKLLTAPREHLWPVLRVPLLVAALSLVGVAVGDPRFYMVQPVLVQAVLLAQFAGSLRGPVPIVERFARLQDPALPDNEVPYCRRVTEVWSLFFVLNGVALTLLALLAPPSWWALYSGLLGYVVMGLLFAGEYLVRKWRFRRYGSGLHDRFLSLLMPPREVDAPGQSALRS